MTIVKTLKGDSGHDQYKKTGKDNFACDIVNILHLSIPKELGGKKIKLFTFYRVVWSNDSMREPSSISQDLGVSITRALPLTRGSSQCSGNTATEPV